MKIINLPLIILIFSFGCTQKNIKSTDKTENTNSVIENEFFSNIDTNDIIRMTTIKDSLVEESKKIKPFYLKVVNDPRYQSLLWILKSYDSITNAYSHNLDCYQSIYIPLLGREYTTDNDIGDSVAVDGQQQDIETKNAYEKFFRLRHEFKVKTDVYFARTEDSLVNAYQNAINEQAKNDPISSKVVGNYFRVRAQLKAITANLSRKDF